MNSLHSQPPQRVLVFFPHNPYPARTGAHQRCLTVLRALTALQYDVILCSSTLLTDQPWNEESRAKLQADLNITVEVYEGQPDDHTFMAYVQHRGVRQVNFAVFCPPGLKRWFKQQFQERSPQVVLINYALWSGLILDPAFDSVLKLVESHDLVTLSMKMQEVLAPYVARTVSTADEIDATVIDEQFFQNLGLDASDEEYWYYDQFDGAIAISAQEAQQIQSHTTTLQVQPIPITANPVALENTYTTPPVFVCGDNPFNIQGYWFFVKRVLPLVQSSNPNFGLTVIGSACKKMFPVNGIELVGFVPNLQGVYATSKFAICPLIGGTGQQVKIVEAMAHGLPVVAMKQTGQSSPIQHGINGFIAQNAAEFAQYTALLDGDRALCERMGTAAREAIAQTCADAVLLEKLRSLLALTPHPPARLAITPRIVVDGVFFEINNTGIARVWASVLAEWAKGGFAKHIVVVDRKGTAPVIPGVRYRALQSYQYDYTALDSQVLQAICDEERADLFISSYYTTPTTTPSVFMGYDMIPEIFQSNLNHIVWREKRYGILHAHRYITISASTACDLRQFFPHVPETAVTVAHCGLSPDFHPATTNEILAFKEKFNITKPYFVVIGERVGLYHYKNVRLLYQALHHLPNRTDYSVLCVGGQPQLEQDLRVWAPDVTSHMVRLSDEELRIAYSGAIALVYPSLHEGFGLPIGEAMLCGCPVITCRNSSIPEVAGEAVLYVEERCIEGMQQAIAQVQDPTVRAALIEAGFTQAAKFSWEKMAAIMADVLVETAQLETNPLQNPLPQRPFHALWQEFRDRHLQEQEYQRQLKQHNPHEIDALKGQLQTLQAELAHTQQQLSDAKGRIEAMETSKFWQLRSLWFRVKRKLGLPLNE